MAERRLSRARRELGSVSTTVLEIAESGVRRGEFGAEESGDERSELSRT
jgi:hypothetical protein